jgi:glycine/D-amino acid oxidase-like deaminating enzyme
VSKKVWCVLMVSSMLTLQAAHASGVYRCPGNPVLYTDAISAKQAQEKGCKLLEGSSVTVIQSSKPRGGGASSHSSSNTAVPISGPASTRVDPAEQRARDSDARRILETELNREEARLTTMRQEFNNGEPERLGNERNAQKYQDRIAEMKEAINRKEADIASLKRELTKK